MVIRGIVPIAIIFLMPACTDHGQDRGSSTSSREKQQPQNSRAEVVDLPLDRNLETKTQLAFEEDHQPWRASADWVACSEIGGLLRERNTKPDLDLTECLKNTSIQQTENKRAIVDLQMNKIRYRVYLERLVKPDGIWTARKIEVLKGG